MRALIAVTMLVAALFSAQTQAQTISEDEYRQAVLVLFEEFLQMRRDGVFLDQATIELLGPDTFSNVIRGDNAPGGWFARPPGSDWLARVQRLTDSDHKLVFIDIPPVRGPDFVGGHDLFNLYSGIIDSDDPDFLDLAVARFWLATICHKSPEACEAYIEE